MGTKNTPNKANATVTGANKSGGATTGATKTASPTTSATADENDTSLAARTGRTIKERPYTSAAIATGAVGVVAAAAGAAYLLTRRDKSFKEASGELSAKVKGGLASAAETVKDGLASATETAKDLGQRGTDYFKGDGSASGTETRTQQQIAEEALTLKETGAVKSPVDALSATEIKTGAVSY